MGYPSCRISTRTFSFMTWENGMIHLRDCLSCQKLLTFRCFTSWPAARGCKSPPHFGLIKHSSLKGYNKFEGHLNPRLFNHEYFNPGYFNHELFNHELFNHKLFNHELCNRELFNQELFNHELFNHELFSHELFNPKVKKNFPTPDFSTLDF